VQYQLSEASLQNRGLLLVEFVLEPELQQHILVLELEMLDLLLLLLVGQQVFSGLLKLGQPYP